MCHKAPVSFDFQKYAENHCNGPWWKHNEIRKHGEITQTILFLIWLTSFGHDWKVIKARFMFMKNVTLKLVWFQYFPWVSWAHYGKTMLRPVLFPNESQNPSHYFLIFSATNKLNQTSFSFRTSFNILFLGRMFLKGAL